MLKFGIQNGLNVARLGLTEDQILTACSLADKTGYHSIWYMDHSNVPQWSNAIVNDPWVMLAGIAAVTNNVELGTCVTDALRRHPSNIALASITLDRLSKGRGTLGIGAGEAQNLKEFNIPFDNQDQNLKNNFKLSNIFMIQIQITEKPGKENIIN